MKSDKNQKEIFTRFNKILAKIIKKNILVSLKAGKYAL
jgi:hypothetical protein